MADSSPSQRAQPQAPEQPGPQWRPPKAEIGQAEDGQAEQPEPLAPGPSGSEVQDAEPGNGAPSSGMSRASARALASGPLGDPVLTPLPLQPWHEARGARLAPFAGFAMPLHYEAGILAEHLWTRAHAGLFDVSHMGQLVVSGEKAASWLETLMPGDFLSLKSGRQRYSLLLAADGGILDDVMVARDGDRFRIVVNAGRRAADREHFDALRPPGVELVEEDRALLALQGPEAAAVLEPLMPGVGALPFMGCGWFEGRLGQAFVSRSGYTGEDGFELSLPSAAARAAADALASDARVRPVGLGARDSLRLEAGLPLHGADIGPDTTPIEAGLGFAIAKRRKMEGGFPGAERVLGQLLEGAPRRRVGLLLGGRLPARGGAPVSAGGRPVGRVTSGGFSPSLNRPIAMAMVDIAAAADGTPLEIEVRGRQLAATVVPLPFVPKSYVR